MLTFLVPVGLLFVFLGEYYLPTPKISFSTFFLALLSSAQPWMVLLNVKPPLFPGTGPISAATHGETLNLSS